MTMTDAEFDVMDELYFVQPYTYLLEELTLKEEELKATLRSLLEKGYIKCFFTMNDEVFEDQLNFEKEYKTYYYLATKTGLLAHNGR
ncbi:hypothetical protein [Roseivirga thermotolerans]|uniref:hypothetical protein n=2 Tax=Roseivirga thermotolerans TaxID=1758176 RepID=UPI00273EABB8|nr:hypothetical protein [Roseivirga thermotolerans]